MASLIDKDRECKCQQPTKQPLLKDRVVIEIDDISDELELKGEVHIGSPPVGKFKVRKVVGEEHKPKKSDGHI